MARFVPAIALLALAAPAAAQRNTAGCSAAAPHRLIVEVRGLRAWYGETIASGELAEGVTAFAERRPPRFGWAGTGGS